MLGNAWARVDRAATSLTVNAFASCRKAASSSGVSARADFLVDFGTFDSRLGFAVTNPNLDAVPKVDESIERDRLPTAGELLEEMNLSMRGTEASLSFRSPMFGVI